MVADDHDLTRAVGRIHAARGIGDDQHLDSQEGHDPHRESDLPHTVPFIVMGSALHDYDRLPFKRAQDQSAGVS